MSVSCTVVQQNMKEYGSAVTSGELFVVGYFPQRGLVYQINYKALIKQKSLKLQTGLLIRAVHIQLFVYICCFSVG